MINILYLHAGAELYGADIILYNILKNIDREKFTPYVVLPNEGPLVEKIRDLGIFCEVVNYPILRRQYFNFKGIFKFMLNYIKASNSIIKSLPTDKIDIIHSNTIAVLEGSYLKHKLRCKLIFHVHEMLENPHIIKWFISKFCSFYGDKTICVSSAVKNHLEKDAKFKNIQVIYNGIDCSIFHPDYNEEELFKLKKELNLKPTDLVIGMVGRVNSIKGQDHFLLAIEPLLKKYDCISGLLVGGVFQGQEWRFEELRKKINKLNEKYGNRINLIDFRTDNYLIHNIIDIFILPSTGNDSFPTVVLEAMASKKAVIGYKCGGISEMIVDGKSGFLIPLGDYQLLSEKIERLIIDKKLRQTMGEKACLLLESNFSIYTQIKSIEKAYFELLGNNN